MSEAFQREVQEIPPGEYRDSCGRVVVPYPRSEGADPWVAYIRAFDAGKRGKQCLRSLVANALEFPEQALHSAAGVAQALRKGAAASKPWTRDPHSPYEPFLWRTYELSDADYDLVVYRRPRRGWVCKLFCCGA